MNKNEPAQSKSSGLLTLLGLPVLLAACCGLPLLLTAFGFTAAGAFLTGKEYWVFGGFMLIIGLAMLIKFLVGRRSKSTGGCTVPKDHRSSSAPSNHR
ncbi:hypothetical protein O9H85_23560 [Paenibacillus filicis]|uniref:Uncharacterized protein n=1 Tax=Paenibacillus gyeongsangnamensis TaxID=3388067 RepID=A0ABT4QEV9_9BACL|nr:hypothetical protein [Paenibacillus filicis]MCZ8515332.1 hypothetical protein [Paenibacillus filicis]